eukprot:EG_transcript_826
MSHEEQGEQYYEGQYEPQYEENFLQEGEQGEEVSVNIPGGEEYPECDDVGLTEDAIRIIQDFVLGNGHLRLTAEQVAEVMRDVDGNEREESLYYAKMVLDVWRMHNPHLEGLEDEYPREEAPEPVGREEYYEEHYEGVVEEEVVEREVVAEPQPVYAEPELEYISREAPVHVAEPEPEYVIRAEPAHVVEPEPAYASRAEPARVAEPEPAVVAKPVPEPKPASKVVEPAVIQKEPSDGYSAFRFKVPLRDEYPFYNEMVDFASRLLENFVVANGNLKIAHHDLGKSLLEPDGKLTVKAADLADMVLEVWRRQNPHLEVGPRIAAYDLASEEGQVVVTMPADDDYPPFDRAGILSSAVRAVRNFALQTGTLALTVDQIVASLPEFQGSQAGEVRAAAAAVLDAFRKRNPDLPSVAVPPAAREVPVGVIQKDTPTPATIALPGGATLVIPLESDYPSFDRSGLTDDAIRIIREFVTDTGSLGITPELVAAQMVDFMGNTSPESLSIAASVLAVWRSRNPSLPLTSVKEIYPGVVDPAGQAKGSAPISSSDASRAVVLVDHSQAASSAPTNERKGQEVVQDPHDAVYEAELAKLLERLDCEVEAFFSPTFGAGVRIKTLSSKGTLYRSGAEPGDAIISMDNLAVTKVSQLYTLLNRVAIGAKFTWRLRRVTVSGNVSEWCVILTIPDRPKKAIEPRFAGLPAPKPYQSHSGLLPNDPGFERRYAEVPGTLIQPPSHVPTQLAGTTRIIQGTGVIPAGLTLYEPQAAPLALPAPVVVSNTVSAPAVVSSPARIALGVDYASGTRTVYPLEGQPYTVPLTTPYISSASAVAYSAPEQTIVHAAPAVEVVSTPVRAVSHVASSHVVGGTHITTSAIPGSSFSRREVVPASWVDIENVKERMLRKYESSINRTVAVTEERIPASSVLGYSSVLRSSRAYSPAAVPYVPTRVPYAPPPMVHRGAAPACQPCSPARSTYSYL